MRASTVPAMDGAATVAAVLGGVSLTMCLLILLARHVRRRGTAGQALAAAMAAYDESMHVTAHEAYVEVRSQDERGVSARSPADE